MLRFDITLSGARYTAFASLISSSSLLQALPFLCEDIRKELNEVGRRPVRMALLPPFSMCLPALMPHCAQLLRCGCRPSVLQLSIVRHRCSGSRASWSRASKCALRRTRSRGLRGATEEAYVLRHVLRLVSTCIWQRWQQHARPGT